MRRTFALLMFLILASTPVLDGGCFTSRLITGGRKEYWRDLHGPCAAYVGADRSLTLVLPDCDDLKKAKFFAVKFSAKEVRSAERVSQGTSVGQAPFLLLGAKKEVAAEIPNPNQGSMAWHAPMENSPWRPPYVGKTISGETALVFTPSRDGARVSPLPGTSETEWMKSLPAGGYWLHAGAPNAPAPFWHGFSTRYNHGNMFGPVADPAYQDNNWNLCIAQSGGWFTYCQVQREGGTYMAPTAQMFLVPVTLVLDVVTSPIQLVFAVGAVTSH